MKVILDGMALGAGYENPTGRTGIYRVVDHLLWGLANDKTCQLSLIATNFHHGAKVYCLDNKQLNLSLKYPTITDRLIEKVRNRVKPTKLMENLIPLTNLEKLVGSSDIYHSPYSPIPDVIKRSKIKKVLTVHDIIPIIHPEYFPENHIPYVEVAINSIKDDGLIFCVSHSTKYDLCSHFNIDPSRVIVTHLAASPTIFKKMDSPSISRAIQGKYGIGPEPYFLSLCTFEPRKNIDHTIRSFISLVEQQNIKRLNLVLIGTMGWDFMKILNELKGSTKFSLGRIILTGYVKDEDLAYLYSGALGFLYPSFYEGFGLPPLEAMQCGLPVITSNTSSLPEVVGDAGIMVDPSDGDELCQAMYKLYEDQEYRDKLAHKSLERSKSFGWDKFTKETIDGYERAMLEF